MNEPTDCRTIQKIYQKHCFGKYFEKYSPDYLFCQNLMQSFQKCYFPSGFRNK